MAHNLNFTDGRYSFAYQDATPWHTEGFRLKAGADVDTALDAANLRYQVDTEPIYLKDGTPVLGQLAIGRRGTRGLLPWAVVGDGYKVVQGARETPGAGTGATTDLLRPLVELGCSVAATGALGQGEKAWMLMKLPEATVAPVDGDDVRGYFLLHWAHDGSGSVVGTPTPIRVVCQNTLNVATAGAKRNWLAIRHTSSAGQRLDQAAALVKSVTQAMIASGETYRQLAERALTPQELAAYIAGVVPNETPDKELSPVLKARRDTLARLTFGGVGAGLANQLVDVAAGQASAWAAYNAISEYFDHVRPAEAQSAAGVSKANQSAIFGGNALIKAQALTLARQLVAA